jgi:hypothetical protein
MERIIVVLLFSRNRQDATRRHGQSVAYQTAAAFAATSFMPASI